jgi:probable HAF family extracellular repeat protein
MTDMTNSGDRRRRPRPGPWTNGLAALAALMMLGTAGAADAGAAAAGGSGLPTARGRVLATAPLQTVDAVSDAGVLGGATGGGIAALWDPRTGAVRELGLLPGSFRTSVNDIDDRGRAVGNAYESVAPHRIRPFRWTPQEGMADLGGLGGTLSNALAVNNGGQVVGASYLAGDAVSHAWRWTARRGLEDLGTLPGHTNSAAVDLNGDGLVVGVSEGSVPAPGGDRWIGRGFLWSSGRGMVDLGSLGGDSVSPAAIDERGDVAGTATTADGSTHVFRWSRGTGMVDLGGIGVTLAVRGLTDSGAIAGSWRPGSATSDYRSFLYTPGCGFQDLGLPVAAEGAAFVSALNDRGRIAVQLREGDSNQPYRIVVWQAERLNAPC